MRQSKIVDQVLICSLYKQGFGSGMIAIKFSISPTKVMAIITDHNIPRILKRSNKTFTDMNQAIEQYDQQKYPGWKFVKPSKGGRKC